MSLSLIKMTKIDDGIKNVETETDIGKQQLEFIFKINNLCRPFDWSEAVQLCDCAASRGERLPVDDEGVYLGHRQEETGRSREQLEVSFSPRPRPTVACCRNKLSYQFPALIQDHNTPIGR